MDIRPNIIKQDFINSYELFIFDLWGVIHNGQQPFTETVVLMGELIKQKKMVFLLSNSPRLANLMPAHLAKMRITPDFYQGIYTSGTDCHLALKKSTLPFYQNLGGKLYHLGPRVYDTLFTTLPQYQMVNNINDADFLLLTGIDKHTDKMKDYQPLLDLALGNNLPLVCANADKQVIYGKQSLTSAGFIAETYAKRGGRVQLHGKPDKFMYQAVHQLAEKYADKPIAKDKIIMLGDSLATDIRGANNYGIDSILLLTGVHQGDLAGIWDQSCNKGCNQEINQPKINHKVQQLFTIHKSYATYVALKC